MKNAASMTTPSTFGQVVVDDAVDGILAEPVEREHPLGEDRATEQQAEVEAEDRHDRGERSAQTVLHDDAAFPSPLARAVRM